MNLHKIILRFISNKKILVYIIIIFVLGVFLIIIPNKSDKKVIKNKVDKPDIITHNETNLCEEDKLEYILNKVEGVGNIEIIINYTFFDKNYNKSTVGDFANVSKYITSDSTRENNFDSNNYNILGVVVAAQGADNESIVSMLRTCISEYLCVPLHKISVLKLK